MMSPLEWSAAIVCAVSVYLGVRQNIWVWPVGLLGVALYALVFWQARLYANTGLQVFFFGAQVYGWWAWLHGGQGGQHLHVARTPRAWLGGLLLGGAALSVGLGFLLNVYAESTLPYLDATLSAFSVVAQLLMTRKWIESWLIWITVDVAYVGMLGVQRMYPSTALYAVFLVLATLGWREWRRELPASDAAPA